MAVFLEDGTTDQNICTIITSEINLPNSSFQILVLIDKGQHIPIQLIIIVLL